MFCTRMFFGCVWLSMSLSLYIYICLYMLVTVNINVMRRINLPVWSGQTHGRQGCALLLQISKLQQACFARLLAIYS